MALWPFGTKEDASLSKEQKAALGAVVANAKYELLPLKNVRDQAAAVPPKSQVTVTASPQHTLETTLEVCEFVAGLGHEVTPHFSARMTRDKAHLTDLLARAKAIGLTKVFVVGGDAKEPGDYPDGLSLLRAMAPDVTARYARASDLLDDVLGARTPPPSRRTPQPASIAAVEPPLRTPREDPVSLQSRLRQRDTPAARFCWHCRKPLHARSDKCPFCNEAQ